MHKIQLGLEKPWFKDPEVADTFGGQARVETVEGTSINIRIDGVLIDLVELTIAQLDGDDAWVWDTPDGYGRTKDAEAARTAATKRGWHEAMLLLRLEMATEVTEILDNIARTAATAVRDCRGSEDD